MNRGLHGTLALCAGMAVAILGSSAIAQDAPASDAGAPSRTIQMVQVQAELATTLDAKKAKQGDQVKAKLAGDVRIPDGEQLPRNTILEGHIDQVQPSQNRGDSTLVVTFDKAKLKDGRELPIKATVVSVSEPVNQFQQQQQPQGTPSSPGAMPGAGPAGSGGSGLGGGSAAQMPRSPDQPLPQEGGAGAIQQAGMQSARNGVPGVMLTSDIHQHTSATFTSKGRNVKVPDGTQMQLAITVIPPGVNIQ